MTWRAKLYGVGLFMCLTGIMYLGVEGLALLTIKDSALIRAIDQLFPEQRLDLRARWLGALAQLDAHSTAQELKDSPSQLAVTLIGLSTLRDGVDVSALKASLKAPLSSTHRGGLEGEVLSLSGSGGTLKSLQYITEPILSDPRYRSRLGVVLLHPMWLAGWEASPSTPTPPRDAPLQERLSAQLKRFSQQHLWLVSHKTLISQGLNIAISDAREAYLEGLWGLPPTVNVAPFKAERGAELWYKAPVKRASAQAAPQLFKQQWSAWEQMGRADQALYERNQGEQLAALKALIAGAEGRVGHWLIVRMAERSELRSLPPPTALELLTERSLHDRLGRGVSVWDASEVVPDEGFFDYAHINEYGRALFTEALASRVKLALGD